MSKLHIIKDVEAEEALCGSPWEAGTPLNAVRASLTMRKELCEACLKVAGFSADSGRALCKYTVTVFTPTPFTDREREYLEDNIAAYLPYKGQAHVPATYDEVDAEEYELEHLLPSQG